MQIGRRLKTNVFVVKPKQLLRIYIPRTPSCRTRITQDRQRARRDGDFAMLCGVCILDDRLTDARLLPAHNQIRMMLRHGSPAGLGKQQVEDDYFSQ